MKPPPEILCVYCLKTKLRPVKGEHIILDALGGRARTRDVCDDCNQTFGNTIDRQFMRHSLVALHRFYDPEVTGGQMGEVQFFACEHGGFLDSKILNSHDRRMPPQGYVRDEKSLVIVAPEGQWDEAQSVVAGLQGWDAQYAFSIHDDEHHSPTRIVIDLSGHKHRIRARTQADADQFVADLKKGYPIPGAVATVAIVDERTMVHFSPDFNQIGRCVVKMAFNMATLVLGPETMLQETFNPVRAYIRGVDVIDGPTVTKEGNPGLKVDWRFLDPWLRTEGDPDSSDTGQLVRPTIEHQIELTQVRGQLGARLEFVGGVEIFVAKLGPLTGVDCALLPRFLICKKDADYWGNAAGEWISNADWSNMLQAANR